MRQLVDAEQLLRQLEHGHALFFQKTGEFFERNSLVGFGHNRNTDALTHDFVVDADNADLGHLRMPGQLVIDLIGRDVNAATYDDVLAASDKFVKLRIVAVTGDLENVARTKVTVLGKTFRICFGRLVLAIDNSPTPDLEFALLADFANLLA